MTKPFDCHAALQNWDARWSSKKKARLRAPWAPWGRMVAWDEVVKRLLPCCAVSQIPRYGTSVSLWPMEKEFCFVCAMRAGPECSVTNPAETDCVHESMRKIGSSSDDAETPCLQRSWK